MTAVSRIDRDRHSRDGKEDAAQPQRQQPHAETERHPDRGGGYDLPWGMAVPLIIMTAM